MPGIPHHFTIPNALSALRLPAAPLCAWAVLEEHLYLAVGLFYLAVMSDLLDGRIARRWQQTSPFGALLDHGSDAIFVTTVLSAWAVRGEILWLLPLLIALAFIQYTFDSRALQGALLRTSRIGRYNGVLYFVLAGIPTTREALGWHWPSVEWVFVVSVVLAASTVVSMIDRGWAWLRTRRAAERR